MNIWVVIAVVVLFSAGILAALIRVILGSSVLDRITASDAIMGAMLCLLGFEMVLNKHTSTLPVMIAISMFAMLGTVSVARYIRRSGVQDPEAEAVVMQDGRTSQQGDVDQDIGYGIDHSTEVVDHQEEAAKQQEELQQEARELLENEMDDHESVDTQLLSSENEDFLSIGDEHSPTNEEKSIHSTEADGQKDSYHEDLRGERE